jgi:hydrogenase expression/formation protein HypC
MCLAIPGKVLKISGRQATVQYPGETRTALIAEKGVKPGDCVLVQMGLIVKILTPTEAKVALRAWKS